MDFWEVGASGTRYDRDEVWAVLEKRYRQDPSGDHDVDWETSDFEVREVAPDTYLLTYTLLQVDRLTRRATLWQRRAGEWTILYHQGTVVL
ncbi:MULTISPECIES: nuclear transport factor 2 family protein [unclassified Rhodococcus (in: high G+C Gram-positive bacteria)]|uniref:nuclear transport factor 2 family protein n=1 Tax=unclassified Rhodococcus (in: high G+C Gram-positive bacteria) TaxID=192944 RepID=UPI001E3E2389|nr:MULTISPECIES: hypothetical protein [unclassified Rhodococcus (in: high G+C Gram-positive bacteria)]